MVDGFMNLMNKGTSFDSLGKHKEALECYDEAEQILELRKMDTEKTVLQFMLTANKAIAYDNLGDYKASLSQWDKSIKLAEQIPQGYRYISCSLPLDKTSPFIGKAKTLLNMGEFEEAIKICRKVLSLQPNNQEAIRTMGCLSLKTDNYREAISWCSLALRMDEKDVHSLSNLGAALAGVGRFEDARSVLQQVLDMAPTHPPALYSMGTLLVQTGSPERAIPLLKKAVNINPKFSEAWNHLGIALLQAGQRGYRECFERALRADIKNRTALLNLVQAIQAETSCAQKQAIEQALEFINRIQST